MLKKLKKLLTTISAGDIIITQSDITVADIVTADIAVTVTERI